MENGEEGKGRNFISLYCFVQHFGEEGREMKETKIPPHLILTALQYCENYYYFFGGEVKL